MKNTLKKYIADNRIPSHIIFIFFCLFYFFITKNTHAETVITTPNIQIVNIGIEKVTFTSMDIHVELDIYNPNEFPLTVSSLTYSLKVDDALILSDEIKRKEVFHAKKSRHIIILASLGYDENFTNVLALLSKNTDINYSVFGNIQLDNPNPEKSLIFLHNGHINPSTYIKKNTTP